MIKRTNRPVLIFIFFLSIAAISCNNDIIYTDTYEMPENTWRLTDIPVFRIPVSDTSASADVSFSIRTGSDYPFRNIFLFVNTISPEGISITDTLEYSLADEKGYWLGKGVGDIHELVLPYKTNVFFPVKGPYQVKVYHGMRLGDLKGVYDLGIRVEKHHQEKR
jgi:gliding motility-associated lipoprotein GldH